jgi:hypothetical protein
MPLERARSHPEDFAILEFSGGPNCSKNTQKRLKSGRKDAIFDEF